MTEKNVQKSVMYVQSCCFANLIYTYRFFDVLVAIAFIVARAPYYHTILTSNGSLTEIMQSSL